MTIPTTIRFVTLLICCTLQTGCDDGRGERMAALNRLVGQPEQTLLLTMGVPTRSYDSGGVKYLAYDEQLIDIIPGTPGVGPWNLGAVPPQPIERSCETTFQVAQGIVRSFILRGNACD
jgi:hypothetical protein